MAKKTKADGTRTDRRRGLQWTVRGVSHETRNAARLAAKRAGMSLGDWIDATLRTAATSELKDESKGPPPVRLDDVVTVLEKVSDRQREQGKVQGRIIAQLAATATDLKQAQDARFAALERQDADQAKVLLAVAEKLDDKIDGANRGRDEALRALVDKLDVLATPRRGLFGALLGRR